MEQLGVDALLPAAALVHQGAVQPAQAADLQHVCGRDPRLREPPLQQPECTAAAASARSVLARFFGPRSVAISAGSPRCTPTPAAANSSLTYRHPVPALQRELAIPVRTMLAQPAPQRLPCRWTNLTPCTNPVVVHVIKGDLLSMHIKAPTMVIGTCLTCCEHLPSYTTSMHAEGVPHHMSSF